MLLLHAVSRVRAAASVRAAPLVRGLASRTAALRQESVPPSPPPPAPSASLVPYSSRTAPPDDSGVPADDPRVPAKQREFLLSQLAPRVLSGQRAARVAAATAEYRALHASYVGALAHAMLVRVDLKEEDVANPWRWSHEVYADALPPPPGAPKPSAAELAHGARVAAAAARRFRSVDDSDASDSELGPGGSGSGSESEDDERALSALLEESGPAIDAIGREIDELGAQVGVQ